MKFKGLTSMVLAGATILSMAMPTFAADVSEQSLEQANETAYVTSAESLIDSTDNYKSTENVQVAPKVNILGNADGGYTTNGSSEPTSLWDFSDGSYQGSCLPIYRGRYVFTNKRFKTSTKKLKVDLNMYADVNWTHVRKLTVIVYKKTLSGWSQEKQTTFIFAPDASAPDKTFSRSYTFTGLSDSDQYCIKLVNDSANAGGSSADYAIGCDIVVSES